MNALFAQLNQWLAARTPHERRLLLLGITVVAAALLFSLAEWTWKEQSRLQRRLPEVRQQLTRMQEEASELQRLKRSPPAASIALSTLAQSAEAAAKSRGFDITVKTLPDSLEISGSAPFQMITDWLASMQADYNLRPQNLTMNDGDSAVSFTVLLTPTVIP